MVLLSHSSPADLSFTFFILYAAEVLYCTVKNENAFQTHGTCLPNVFGFRRFKTPQVHGGGIWAR